MENSRTPKQIPRRSRRNYHKMFLERHIFYSPRRGLGQHRLPKLRPRKPLPQQKPPKLPLPPGVKFLIVLGITVLLFICTIVCLIPIISFFTV